MADTGLEQYGIGDKVPTDSGFDPAQAQKDWLQKKVVPDDLATGKSKTSQYLDLLSLPARLLTYETGVLGINAAKGMADTPETMAKVPQDLEMYRQERQSGGSGVESQKQVLQDMIALQGAGAPFAPKGTAVAGTLIGGAGRRRLAGAGKEDVVADKEWAARQMEARGASPTETWRKIGLERGFDGHWRSEVLDHEATYSPGAVASRAARYKAGTDEGEPYLTALREIHEKGYEAPISEFIDHPELFKAYPQLRQIKVIVDGQDRARVGKYGGHWNAVTKELVLAPDLAPNLTTGKKVILHELQHAVQSLEGLEGGANDEWIRGGHIGLKPDARFKARVEKDMKTRDQDFVFPRGRRDRIYKTLERKFGVEGERLPRENVIPQSVNMTPEEIDKHIHDVALKHMDEEDAKAAAQYGPGARAYSEQERESILAEPWDFLDVWDPNVVMIGKLAPLRRLTADGKMSFTIVRRALARARNSGRWGGDPVSLVDALSDLYHDDTAYDRMYNLSHRAAGGTDEAIHDIMQSGYFGDRTYTMKGDPADAAYMSNAGEVEARNNELRSLLPPQYLKLTPPSATEGVSRDVQWGKAAWGPVERPLSDMAQDSKLQSIDQQIRDTLQAFQQTQFTTREEDAQAWQQVKNTRDQLVREANEHLHAAGMSKNLELRYNFEGYKLYLRGPGPGQTVGVFPPKPTIAQVFEKIGTDKVRPSRRTSDERSQAEDLQVESMLLGANRSRFGITNGPSLSAAQKRVPIHE